MEGLRGRLFTERRHGCARLSIHPSNLSARATGVTMWTQLRAGGRREVLGDFEGFKGLLRASTGQKG
jgi:hypothetical protein